jgi:hypothetical protein
MSIMLCPAASAKVAREHCPRFARGGRPTAFPAIFVSSEQSAKRA